MKWIETRVVFQAESPDMAAEVIADIFHDLGLGGVVVEDPGDDADLDWADGAVHRPGAHAVIGYLPKNPDLDARRQQLGRVLEGRGGVAGIEYRIEEKEIDQEDWAESWKAYFWPEKVGERLVVKPTWRDYDAAKGEMVIEIDPGMAFGTGTHATTALCLRMIEHFLEPGARVLDVGTGSGILMIAAARLGAATVTGIDNDAVATQVAGENLRLNGIDPGTWRVSTADLVDAVTGPYDFVVANILSEVILTLLEDVGTVLRPGGIFLCSGIIEENRDAVERKMKAVGFTILETRDRASWVAIAGRKEKRPGEN
jgi:ribosomal protein L11 methyltransferase